MKYKSITEILEDESLGLSEIHNLIFQFLEEKGMSMEEFMATKEGMEILRKNYETPIEYPENMQMELLVDQK